MTISSVSPNIAAQATSVQATPIPPAPRTEKNEGNDGDKDDRAVSVQAIKPTTNSAGETIGSLISAKA